MTQHPTAEPLPVLLDTDIGTNIDDALALTYLLRQPHCRLVGITTTHGDTLARAQLASALCIALGRNDMPIHRGAERPLRLEPTRPAVPQRSLLTDCAYKEDFEPDSAVDFLRDRIHAQPGQLTWICIGPLTNAAILFQHAPETARLLKQMVCMGGVYFSSPAGYGPIEWNMAADPEAAARVLVAEVPRIRFIGLDVTTQCRFDAIRCRKLFQAADLPLLSCLAEHWSRLRDEILFHDPLAAAVAFAPDLCRYRRGRVRVPTHPAPLAGRSHLATDDPSGRHQVAWDVMSERFFAHFWEVIRQRPAPCREP